MKKLLIILALFLFIPTTVFAQAEAVLDQAAEIGTDTSSFGGILSASDDTAQKAFDTIDDVTIAPDVSTAPVITATATSAFSADRVLTAGEAIDIADGGANTTLTVSVEDATDSNKGAVSVDTANLTIASGVIGLDQTSLAITISQIGDFGTYQLIVAEGAFVDGDKTKLDGIEASADVTDTANVTSSGAVMDSEVTNLSQVKAFDTTDYATAAQGALADSSSQATGVENSADVTDTANVTSAGAVMDSELTSITDVKALDQSVVSGATPTFTGTNITGIVATTGLTATGTKNSTTILYGDDTWKTAPTGGSGSGSLVVSDSDVNINTAVATMNFADSLFVVTNDAPNGVDVNFDEASLSLTESQISDLTHTTDTTLNLAGVETITGNWVNTTNPWADNEVVDSLTITNISQVSDITATASEINTPLDGASVLLTEFKELETINTTSISSDNWTALSNLSGTNTGDQTSVTGNAGTATALAANGANCSSGSYPLGVDASGAAEGCTVAGSGGGDVSLSGSPADTQVSIFSAGSTITGDAGFTYNKTTDTLTVVGSVLINGGAVIDDVTTVNATLTVSGTGATIEFTTGETADPCGSLNEGTLFYNTTANVFCFCDGTNDLKVADNADCF